MQEFIYREKRNPPKRLNLIFFLYFVVFSSFLWHFTLYDALFMPFVAINEYFFYICVTCESEMSVKRLISVFAAFCLLAGCEISLSAESFQLAFKVGKSSIDTTYIYNARACARMYGSVSSLSDAKITVTSYSSPDGKVSRNHQLARLRAASVQDYITQINPSLASSIDIIAVDEDWDGVKSYLKRSNKEWKKDALEIIDSSSDDKKALLQDLWVGEAWDDLLKNCFPSLRRVSVAVQMTDNQRVGISDNSSEIIFKQAGSRLPSNVLSMLKDYANSGAETLYLNIKSSPEGTLDGNTLLSQKRAAAIEKALRQYGYSGSVSVQFGGEDWNGLLEAVKASTDMSDKESVIDILSDTTLDRDSRKKALQALSYGKTWLRLMDTEMKSLRKAVISHNMIL